MSKLFKFTYAAVAITGALAIFSGCKNSSTKAAGGNTENSHTPLLLRTKAVTRS